MKNNTKRIVIITILIMVSMLTILFVSKIFFDKSINKLPEVKLQKIEKEEKTFAVMIQNGDKYQEYEGEKWPDNDEYVFTKSECVDNNGNVIDNGVNFDNEKSMATLVSNKTISCTLYFDKKYDYMKVITHSVKVNSTSTGLVPVYMSEKVKHVYFVDYIKGNLSESAKGTSWWDLSDTSNGTKEGSVIAWIEPITNDTGYNNLYIGSEKKIRATSLSYLFRAAKYDDSGNEDTRLESVDFNDRLDTSKTTTMDSLFNGSNYLTTITGLENWDVSKVENMSHMFHRCGSLNNISFLTNWQTNNLKYTYYMFLGCGQLKDISPLKKWNMSNVTNMSAMFAWCGSLQDISPLNDWDLSNLTTMSSIFMYASGLKKFATNWNLSKVVEFGGAFYYCLSIETINLTTINFSNLKTYANAFYNVPTKAVLTVKDITQKNWVQSNLDFKGTINTLS